MSKLTVSLLLSLTVLLSDNQIEAAEIAGIFNPVILPKDSPGTDTCPNQARIEAARQGISNSVGSLLRTYIRQTYEEYLIPECGSGQWRPVAYLDMTDPSQLCPSAWMEFNSGGVRACERISNVEGGCEGTIYPTNRSYTRICGRATGYQIGGSAAFGWTTVQTIDSYYLYGLSLTYGTPRTHIWTFATGLSEGDHTQATWHCPCTDPGNPNNVQLPSFIGNNYFCESGNPSNTWIANNLYSEDPLWDGEQCGNEGTCCSNENSPPWFRVVLPSPTTDDIEARLCIPPNSAGEEVILQKLEIYIQ